MPKLRHDSMMDYSLEGEKVLQLAAALATNRGRSHIGTDHLAEALLLERSGPHMDLLRKHFMKEQLQLVE